MTVNEKISVLKAAVEELESENCGNCQEWDCDYCRVEADSAERKDDE